MSRKGATEVEKRRKDLLPIQLIYVKSRKKLGLTMCYLWRLMLYSKSTPIASTSSPAGYLAIQESPIEKREGNI